MNKPTKDPKADRRDDVKEKLPHDDREHGEGNYKAAREYDDATREFAKSGKVEPAARSARPRSEREAEEMENAEAEGRSRSKGDDR